MTPSVPITQTSTPDSRRITHEMLRDRFLFVKYDSNYCGLNKSLQHCIQALQLELSSKLLEICYTSCYTEATELCHLDGGNDSSTRDFQLSTIQLYAGRDSSVGIATRYGLVCPGIESLWGREFPHPSRQPPVQRISGLVPRVKWTGRRFDHSSVSSAQLGGTVGLKLYSPSGHSWPVLGWTLPFYVLFIFPSIPVFSTATNPKPLSLANITMWLPISTFM